MFGGGFVIIFIPLFLPDPYLDPYEDENKWSILDQKVLKSTEPSSISVVIWLSFCRTSFCDLPYMDFCICFPVFKSNPVDYRPSQRPSGRFLRVPAPFALFAFLAKTTSLSSDSSCTSQSKLCMYYTVQILKTHHFLTLFSNEYYSVLSFIHWINFFRGAMSLFPMWSVGKSLRWNKE